MKARIKATGKEIIVEPYGDEFAKILPDGDYKVYTKQELVFSNETDWQHYRIQAAIAAMQGMIANPQTFEQLDYDKGYQEIRGGDKSQIVAIASVMYAEALIEELKRKNDVYAEARRQDAINIAAIYENMTKIQKELQKEGCEQ